MVWSRNVWHSWRSGGFCKTLDAKTKICRGLVAVCILILQRVPTPPGALRVNTLLRPALGPVLTSYNENLGCGIIWSLSQSVLCLRTVNGKENYLSELLYCCQRARSVWELITWSSRQNRLILIKFLLKLLQEIWGELLFCPSPRRTSSMDYSLNSHAVMNVTTLVYAGTRFFLCWKEITCAVAVFVWYLCGLKQQVVLRVHRYSIPTHWANVTHRSAKRACV